MGCGEQQTKRTSKKLEHNICYCILPKTDLPMTISNCFFPIDIIKKRSIPDVAETLNSPLVIGMQNNPAVILLHSSQHLEKVYPGHICTLERVVVKFPVFYFLQYHLTGNMKIFYLCCVVIYFSTTVLSSKGVGAG